MCCYVGFGFGFEGSNFLEIGVQSLLNKIDWIGWDDKTQILKQEN